MSAGRDELLLSNYNPYYEGDLSQPEAQETGFGSKLLTAALTVGIGFVVYRGMRGAGFYPLRKQFWQPLKQVQRGHVLDATRRALAEGKWRPVLSPEEIARYVEPAVRRGVGKRTPIESIAHLFSRTIEGIPEVFQYAGFEKTKIYKVLSGISSWVLGGTPGAEPGFWRSHPKYIQQRISEGFRPGSRTPWGVVGRVTTRVIIPTYIATLGYNYLDYRLRRSEALDKTPLREGITVAGASMWVKSRMFMQKALHKVGVLDAHKYLQTQFPGYLRAGGLALGLSAGIRRNYAAGLMSSFIGGALGYAAERGLSYTPEQLERIYSGEEKIPIRRGRWWEFGRTPFEGGRIAYYRPHWYPLLKSRYREQGTLYPSEEWKWQQHWLVGRLTGHKPDPYAWEKEYYRERPYPVTAGIFEDVPLIGPALEGTLGKIIKPRKLMHTEEWLGEGGIKQQPRETERIRRMPGDTTERLQLAGIPRGGMGQVISPADIRHTIGEQQYRLTEWFGLPGFYMQEALEKITGRESLFEQSRLQSARRATGFERNYWDRDLGGLLGTTEIFRRFFPHIRRQIEEYNPIENLMGKRHPWLPGPEYFIDFKHGDPYIKVPMGEARLPGTGYEALNELHSNIPGVYDAVDRFLILADIAPYSEQYKHYRAIVNMWSRAGVLDEKWKGKVKEAKTQRQARMKRYEFQPRRFSRVRKQVDEALETDNLSKIEEAAAKAWEDITHTLSNIPVPGVSYLFGKIMPTRDPIEHYERFQVFGREAAFWEHPIRDFAKVYYQEVRGKMQPSWIPPDVSKRREIEEYFDKIEYIKYKQLAQRARKVDDYELAKEFDKRSKETLHGLDPYGSWANILRAMPKAERDYFSEFIEAEGEERQRIRELVPQYMRRIYEAQWQLKDRKAGIDAEYTRVERQDNEDLAEFFSKHHLPGPNWLGWHPDVNLDNIKLKVVKNEALDMHDFNLWRSQEEEARREPAPFIRDFRTPNPQYDTPVLRRDLIEELTNRGFDFPEIEITTQPSDRRRVSVDFDVSYDQSDKILQRVAGRMPITV